MIGLYINCNLFLGGKNEFARVFTKGNSTYSLTLVVSCTFIPFLN